MVAINFLKFADRWVASAAAPLIQAEFHLDDFRVGLLGSAFLLVYGVAALPFGIWADRGGLLGRLPADGPFLANPKGHLPTNGPLQVSRTCVGPCDAITQNVVPPGLRASAMTLTLLVAHLFGDSYAPAAVGLLSDRLGSLPLALLVTSVPLLLLAAALAPTGLSSIGHDAAAMEARWAWASLEREGGWPPT
ncbi:MAG: hypothetical protein LBJ87_10025 [bacterium]|jgi:MFS family permease|nr:hypothetical protein [bacterium]